MSDSPDDTSQSLCQSCGKRPAVVEFIQVSGDERRQFALCRECAVSHGLSLQVDAFQRLSQLLMHQMRPIGQTTPEEWQSALETKCGKCGLAFEDFVKTGLLGCSQCYRDLHDLLTPILRRLHGVTKQTPEDTETSKPVPTAEKKAAADTRRRELEAQLQVALVEEDYETAATIRDKLKSL